MPARAGLLPQAAEAEATTKTNTQAAMATEAPTAPEEEVATQQTSQSREMQLAIVARRHHADRSARAIGDEEPHVDAGSGLTGYVL